MSNLSFFVSRRDFLGQGSKLFASFPLIGLTQEKMDLLKLIEFGGNIFHHPILSKNKSSVLTGPGDKFAQIKLCSLDSTIIKTYKVNGETILGRAPAARFNNIKTMKRYFQYELLNYKRLSGSRFVPTLLSHSKVTNSIITRYYGPDLLIAEALHKQSHSGNISEQIVALHEDLRSRGLLHLGIYKNNLVYHMAKNQLKVVSLKDIQLRSPANLFIAIKRNVFNLNSLDSELPKALLKTYSDFPQKMVADFYSGWKDALDRGSLMSIQHLPHPKTQRQAATNIAKSYGLEKLYEKYNLV